MALNLEAIDRLTKDVIIASRLTVREIRYLVDAYYMIQEYRKAAGNQIRATDAASEPHALLDWYFTQTDVLEKQLAKALDYFSQTSNTGLWLRSVKGIGPVLAANFLAHLSVEPWRCAAKREGAKRACSGEPCTPACGRIVIQTAGGFWRFAGLDPTLKWGKGERRPFNAALKTACWKASDSWVKLKGHADSYYSRVYVARKSYEVERNLAGELKTEAERALSTRPNHAQRSIYAEGRLPDGHIDNRARRYTAKLFLSHLHYVMYEEAFEKPPPMPYAVAIAGHAHMIEPPGWPVVGNALAA